MCALDLNKGNLNLNFLQTFDNVELVAVKIFVFVIYIKKYTCQA